jgi:hypothetical protein
MGCAGFALGPAYSVPCSKGLYCAPLPQAAAEAAAAEAAALRARSGEMEAQLGAAACELQAAQAQLTELQARVATAADQEQQLRGAGLHGAGAEWVTQAAAGKILVCVQPRQQCNASGALMCL